ncbi:MAG: DNA-binding protein WhiA [Clostridia bacterium]|nr:DNA-binding protein WhiA [Clostridia bacterium]
MKSFSQLTKEELYKAEVDKPCCSRAEYAGMLLFGALITQRSVKFVTENQDVLSSWAELSRKQGMDPAVHQNPEGNARYFAEATDGVRILQILHDFKLVDPATGVIRYRIDESLVQKECCRRALVKGAFLSCGTVIDPRKNYNLELVTPYLGLSRDLEQLLQHVGFPFKTVMRKSKYVLYLKNSEAISDFLAYMGAFQAQMELLNVKIEKEIRNDITRTANSETANLEKTINAAVTQIQAIETIQKTIGLDNLPEDLREIALLRLEHKDLSLSALGQMMNPPLSKSGVNHRLKKLMGMV